MVEDVLCGMSEMLPTSVNSMSTEMVVTRKTTAGVQTTDSSVQSTPGTSLHCSSELGLSTGVMTTDHIMVSSSHTHRSPDHGLLAAGHTTDSSLTAVHTMDFPSLQFRTRTFYWSHDHRPHHGLLIGLQTTDSWPLSTPQIPHSLEFTLWSPPRSLDSRQRTTAHWSSHHGLLTHSLTGLQTTDSPSPQFRPRTFYRSHDRRLLLTHCSTHTMVSFTAGQTKVSSLVHRSPDHGLLVAVAGARCHPAAVRRRAVLGPVRVLH